MNNKAKVIHKTTILLLITFSMSLATAADVAYLLKDTFNPQDNIINSLNNLDLSYHLVDNSEISSTDFNNYKMIIIGDENINGAPVNEYPSLIMDFGYKEGWADRNGQTTANSGYNLEHQTTEGIEGSFKPYEENGHKINYLSNKKTATPITYRSDTVTGRTYYVVSQQTNPRRIMFGITQTEHWTSESKTLFENSLTWILKGGDNDGDGFLAGDDCDDTDPEINPDAEDLTKNCKNDKPTFESFTPSITINKNEEAHISFNAQDPENEPLTFSINSTNFIQTNSNSFSWDSTGTEEGSYPYKVSVTDGEHTVTKDFLVIITNRAPTCNEIPELEWNEDGEATLDLNEYCNDPDEDEITFGIEETSNSIEILLKSFIEGIVKFTAIENWFGEDWIIFNVKDKHNEIPTNNVTLKVKPVNDKPTITQELSHISWNEDGEATINLNAFFKDIDSDLTYSAQGNTEINIDIQGEIATLTAPTNWHGSENVTFKAQDEEHSLETGNVILQVHNINDAPTLNTNNCEENLMEDTTYECELQGEDIEGDSISYSILSESKLRCNLEENKLSYVSYQDYYGEASCRIRITDGQTQQTVKFNVTIGNVNDGPFITSFTPVKEIKILKNTDEAFNIEVNDIDNNELEYTWFINNEETTTRTKNYTFNQGTRGNYEVKVLASDGNLNDSITWNVFVADSTDFTCSEMNGHSFANNQRCTGTTLDVSDTNRCCSIEGEYAFEDIDRCEARSEDLSIEIREPKSREDFLLEDDLDIDVVSRHNYNEDRKAKITTYLYDLTEDKILEQEDERIDIDENEGVHTEFEYGILGEQDIDLDNDYAIFAMIEDRENNACQEDHILIDIEGKDHEINIREASLAKTKLQCEDSIEFKLNLENIGSNDEDVHVIIESQQLGIREELQEEREIKQDKKEKLTHKDFNTIYIPSNTRPGIYRIDFEIYYDNDKESEFASKTIEITSCENNNAGSNNNNGNNNDNTGTVPTQRTSSTTQNPETTISLGEKSLSENNNENLTNTILISLIIIASITTILLITKTLTGKQKEPEWPEWP